MQLVGRKAWRSSAADEGVGPQIDLVIDRDDGIVNLCEIKYSSELKPNKYRWTAEAELSLDDLFQ